MTASAASATTIVSASRPENRRDDRAVDPDQKPVERVLRLGNDPAAHEDHHQHRDERDRKQRRRRHRERLGVGERAEQPSFLRLKAENRQERNRDDEQAEEQRRADLACGLDQNLHAVLVRRGPLKMLVRVLDHDDRRVDHRADRDGDAAKAHDVRAEAERLHRGKCHQHADRQHQDGDQARSGRAEER